MDRIGFGGGCHWCTEAVFQSLIGVIQVEQGFIAAPPPDDSLSEAVIVSFDPGSITLADLIGVHLATHSSTSAHALRSRYRSAIYAFDTAQGQRARSALAAHARQSGAKFITRVLDFGRFSASAPRYHNYYATDPTRPFCQTHIDPKLALLRQSYGALIKEG
jgi:peptide-methionine (S)-S-oxide reductase